MTFEEFEAMQSRLASLDCAFSYYKLTKKHDELWKLLVRFALNYQTNESVISECESYLALHEDLLNKYYQDILVHE